MFWIPFYRILQKTRGNISNANPEELQSAVRQNIQRGESPNMALRTAHEEYVKNPSLDFQN